MVIISGFVINYIIGSTDYNSSVGIVTRYGLDDPGIESRCERDFPHPFVPVLRPTQPPLRCIPGLFPAGKGEGGVALTTPPPSSGEVKERVDLYFYSPSGPSWPALGRNLSLSLHYLDDQTKRM